MLLSAYASNIIIHPACSVCKRCQHELVQAGDDERSVNRKSNDPY
jgi:hypothetical protein